MLGSGKFGTLIHDCSVTGATSNPMVFAKAITGSDPYDDQLQDLAAAGIRNSQGAALAQLGDRFLVGSGAPIGTVAGDRVVCVADGNDSGAKRDLRL
jgi:transaldolase